MPTPTRRPPISIVARCVFRMTPVSPAQMHFPILRNRSGSMKISRTQWLGLAVVIVFGGRMIMMLMEKKDPDVLPSGVRLSDLPKLPEMPMPDLNPVPAEPLRVGSQEAKDLLYCSG